MTKKRNARLDHQDWRKEPMNLYGERQATCTNCGSTEVEWMNQFCQLCWEGYTSEEWWQMIQTALPVIVSGTIDENSPKGTKQ